MAKNEEEIEFITDMLQIIEPEAVGTIITTAIELLIYKHNYNFDSMLETIKRCHYKYSNDFGKAFKEVPVHENN